MNRKREGKTGRAAGWPTAGRKWNTTSRQHKPSPQALVHTHAPCRHAATATAAAERTTKRYEVSRPIHPRELPQNVPRQRACRQCLHSRLLHGRCGPRRGPRGTHRHSSLVRRGGRKVGGRAPDALPDQSACRARGVDWTRCSRRVRNSIALPTGERGGGVGGWERAQRGHARPSAERRRQPGRPK